MGSMTGGRRFASRRTCYDRRFPVGPPEWRLEAFRGFGRCLGTKMEGFREIDFYLSFKLMALPREISSWQLVSHNIDS